MKAAARIFDLQFRTPFLTLCCFLFILSLSLSVRAQTGRITGVVTIGDTGELLVGASVEVLAPDLTSKMGAITDGKGGYVVENVPAGAYTVKATFVGYQATVENVVLTGGESVAVDFRLSVSPYELDKIVVTAQKREENLQKVPVSISAIDARAIRQRGADRLIDLEYAVPNLNFGITSSDDFTRVAIRGIGDYSRNIGYESRAGVYIDGVYAGRSVAVNQDLLDLERVEVLRGPQGTLFGKNTVSGAINFTTRKPHGRYQGKFAIEAGN